MQEFQADASMPAALNLGFEGLRWRWSIDFDRQLPAAFSAIK